MGTVEALEAAKRNNISKFIYLSSASVYGIAAYANQLLNEETTSPQPKTLYEVTKLLVKMFQVDIKNFLELTLSR